MEINLQRLLNNMENMSHIGRNQQGGIDRALGSEAEAQCRIWLTHYWTEHLRLPIKTDSIANLWVIQEGREELPPLVIGSHHDTVTNGGSLDGALGVLLATEILETLLEQKLQCRHPIQVVSFTGEEPNPFQVSTLGSKVLSGRLNKEQLFRLINQEDGSRLQNCMLLIGGNLELSEEDLILPGTVAAFIECHIEQGRRLIDRKRSVASVSTIIGIYRENIQVIGEANHAGTTVMKDRHDALLAAGELNLTYESILKSLNSSEVVGTIGYFSVYPNSVNIIPGKVDMTLELRTVSNEIKESIIHQLDQEVATIEKSRGVRIVRTMNLDQPAIRMDATVKAAINRGMEQIGEEVIELISLAGHDAANLQRVTKAGMIFLPSIDGKSHCPEENTDPQDIKKAGQVMLQAILTLDKELN